MTQVPSAGSYFRNTIFYSPYSPWAAATCSRLTNIFLFLRIVCTRTVLHNPFWTTVFVVPPLHRRRALRYIVPCHGYYSPTHQKGAKK